MDVLVVVASSTVPDRLRSRARHVVDVAAGPLAPDVVADIRTRIPRLVGVTGSGDDVIDVAVALHQSGFPVVVYSDDASLRDHNALTGMSVFPLADSGPAMDVADS